MGSEKYPDENAFDAFIKKHGGSTNAFTDSERVNMFQSYKFFVWFTFDDLCEKLKLYE
jgi:predicted Zn-dependent peptidase